MKNPRRLAWCIASGLFLLLLSIFLKFQTQGISGGDSGDLVTAAVQFGVPHPPGYPLFTFLGFLLSGLPFFTPAWRVGLLSSIPHALTLILLFFLVRRITHNYFSALVTVIVLGGNYLFFLYSITPEVFALYDLFLVTLIYLLFLYQETAKQKFLIAAAFVFGLALTHHQLILFSVPGFSLFLFLIEKKKNKSFLASPKLIGLLLVIFCIGLLPLLYLPLAGHGSAIVNWNRPVDFSSFIHLVSRADYGSFQSGGFYGTSPIQRLVQLQAFGQFMLLDLTIPGLIFFGIGSIWIFRKRKTLFAFIFTILFCIGPLFFFYASFPFLNRFTIGTFERFLLASYVVLSPIIGIGAGVCVDIFVVLGKKYLRAFPSHVLEMCAMGVVLVYPLLLGATTLYRFWGIGEDKTADNLGIDALSQLKPESIFIVSHDTSLFITQYVRYGLKIRPDVVVLQASRLGTPDYPEVIHAAFPALSIPTTRGTSFQNDLLSANSTHPIYSNISTTAPPGFVWLPLGLVYELTPSDHLPTVAALIKENERVNATYHDPNNGILSRYPHLMLADVLDVYAASPGDFGKTLLEVGDATSSATFFQRAIAVGGAGTTPEYLKFLGISYLNMHQCQKAIESVEMSRQLSALPDPDIFLIKRDVYRDCFTDPVRADEQFSLWQHATKEKQGELQQWR